MESTLVGVGDATLYRHGCSVLLWDLLAGRELLEHFHRRSLSDRLGLLLLDGGDVLRLEEHFLGTFLGHYHESIAVADQDVARANSGTGEVHLRAHAHDLELRVV